MLILKSLRAHWGTAFMLTVLALSLLGNVYQAKSVATRGGLPLAGIRVGAQLSQLPVTDVEGTRQVVALTGGERETVVYVLSPSCGWCKANVASIRTLAEQAAERYRFVGVVGYSELQILREHLKDYPLPFDVYLVDMQNLPADIDLTVTPQTVLVDRAGLVSRVWQGAYIGDTREQLVQYFKTSIPRAAELETSTR